MSVGRFSGQVVVVTGASAGIGEAAARGFAREGARLVLAARGEERLEEVAGSIRRDGGDALAVPTDVGDDAACRRLVDVALQRFGFVDVLVNNAGVHHRGPLAGLTAAQAAETIAINLRAPVLLTRLVLDAMLAANRGTIVNVASVAGHAPIPEAVAYSSSKFGLRAFSLALAEELRETGVRVSLVSPGPVSTSFILGDLDRVSDLSLSQPMSTPEEVAEAVLACAADGRRERVLPRSSGTLATAAYLFPPLSRWLRPVLARRGARAKRRLMQRGE